MKTINEQREEIMQVVKDAIKATTFIDDGYAGEVRDLQEAAEAVADTLIEKGYRESDFEDKYKAILESYERVCKDCVQQWKNGYNDGYESGFEDGKEQVEKDSCERGRADEANTAKNEIYALREELRRVSEDSKESVISNIRIVKERVLPQRYDAYSVHKFAEYLQEYAKACEETGYGGISAEDIEEKMQEFLR